MKYWSALLILATFLTMGCGGSDECSDEQPTLMDYIAERNFTGLQTFGTGIDTFQYIILAEGDQTRRPSLSNRIRVGYTGRLTNDEIFDERESIVLSLENVIRGWQNGLQLIGEGGAIQLFLPPSQAYGPSQVGDICPNSPLYFEVQLLELVD